MGGRAGSNIEVRSVLGAGDLEAQLGGLGWGWGAEGVTCSGLRGGC